VKISAAFPSEYLKAADLGGHNVRVLIDRVEMRDVGDDHKPVLFFQGKERGLVLNKTNANNIVVLYGDDTEEWRLKELVLYEAIVDYQGRSVPALRVRGPTAKDRQTRPQQSPLGGNGRPPTPHQASHALGGDHYDPAPAREPIHNTLPDDDIPF
jgi:hypothetical protein